MRRRGFLRLGAAVAAQGALWRGDRKARAATPASVTLLSAPLQVTGDWGASPDAAARTVLLRMREDALAGVALLSDRQPQRLRVEDHSSGPPHIWLHDDEAETAWIVVDIGVRAWSQLAYQFGHELGHVLCNSWGKGAVLKPPTRWLEEAMVEAFSLRGLGRLAEHWQHDPPFPGDSAYGAAIGKYRQNAVDKYRNADGQPIDDVAGWFRSHREALEAANGLGMVEGPGIVAILRELEGDIGCVADLGAVNRWPQRSTVPIEEYLRLWQTSCREIKAPGRLPPRLRQLFALS